MTTTAITSEAEETAAPQEQPGRRWPRRLLMAALVAGGLVAGAGVYDRVWVRTSSVTVNDATVVVRRHRPVVRDALAAAHLHPEDGRALSAVSHRLLPAVVDPAHIWVDGVPAGPAKPIRDGDRIQMVDGVDQTEGLTSRQETGPYVGLPDVERVLWRPGVRQVDVTVIGAISGEVVSSTPIVAAVPARPEPLRVVALTFDDGPNPTWTPAILNVLNAKGVRATFCTVGFAAERFPDLLRLEQADTEVPCDHTHGHIIPLSKRPPAQIVDEIWRQADLIHTTIGTDPVLFRSPGGDVAADVVTQAHRRGLRVMQWSVDPHDYERPSVPVIVARVLNQVRPGAIILLHDGGGDRSETLAALPLIIDGLRAQGYLFTTPLDEPAF